MQSSLFDLERAVKCGVRNSPEADAQTDAETETDAETDAETETDADVETDAEAEAESEADTATPDRSVGEFSIGERRGLNPR